MDKPTLCLGPRSVVTPLDCPTSGCAALQKPQHQQMEGVDASWTGKRWAQISALCLTEEGDYPTTKW